MLTDGCEVPLLTNGVTHNMLTDTKLRALKPRGSPYRVADSNGLCIEVRPSGAKLWRYRYRYADRASMLGLGEYPTMTLAEARAERDRQRVLLKGGANPAHVARIEDAVQTARNTCSFRSVALELIDKREREGRSKGTLARERRWVEKDLGPLIGELPIADVTAPALLAALRKIEAKTVESAHRARSFAGMVFRYAIQTGRAERNPAVDLVGALQSYTPGHFPSLTDPAQVSPLLQALHTYQGTPAVSAALKLAPLVFVRPGELRHALWADIDFDVAEWRYTTSKTGTPHIVPLAVQAIAILRDLHPFTCRSVYVFPSARSANRPMSEAAINAALKTLGYDGKTFTGHGFRAMARTMLDEVLGFRPELIEHQLAHAVRDPLGRAYNRTAHLPERREMMQAWADYLGVLRTGANVMPMKRRTG